MKSKIRIYHFLLDYRIGGPHIYLNSLNEALKHHFEITVITPGRGENTDIKLINLRGLSRSLYIIEILVNTAYIIYLALWKKLFPKGDAIYDIHGTANLAPLLACRILRLPMVWHLHESAPDYRVFYSIGRLFLRRNTDIVVPVSIKTVEVYGVDRFTLAPSPVDIGFWAPCLAATSESQYRDEISIVCVGNLNGLKGQDVLLNSLQSVTGNWRLSLIGSELSTWKKYSNKLHRLAENIRKNSGSRLVEFTGWLEKDAVRNYLSTCDIFILPSRSEACPIALLEAMAMECFCIATDVGSVSQIICNPLAGIVIPTDDASALSAAINFAMSLSKGSRKEYGRYARKAVEREYSLDKVARQHFRIYEQVLSRTV